MQSNALAQDDGETPGRDQLWATDSLGLQADMGPRPVATTNPSHRGADGQASVHLL